MRVHRLPRLLAAAAFAVLTLTALPAAQAQDYPNRPITFVVPNLAGGSSDLIARALGARLTEAMGRPVVIDNKPGASEMLAAELVANGTPDGYTIAIFSNALAINETLSKTKRYDVAKLQPIAKLADLPFAVIVSSTLNTPTLKDFVELAKKQPGKLSYGHVGTGAPHFLTMEWLKRAAGLDIVAVPYKSAPPVFAGLMGGEIEVTIMALGGATPFIQSGKAVALAAMAQRRPVSLPNLPTVAEFGLPEFNMVPWMGVFAPAGLPADIARKLEAEIMKAAASDEFKGYLAKIGLEAAPLSGAPFGDVLKRDIASWASIIKDVGVTAE